MNNLRIYVDTSVLGGYFDKEFEDSTQKLFDLVQKQQLTLLISDTLTTELSFAPQEVQNLLTHVIQSHRVENLSATEEALALQEAYLKAGVLTKKYEDDALHVAQATIARADVIASWNFKHLVSPLRARAFNGVNIAQGYGLIVILTPDDLVRSLRKEDREETDDAKKT